VRSAICRTFWGALCVLVLGSFAAAGRADDSPWLTNFAAAQAKAKAEKKLLLVNFTGSDWCVFCKRLRSEILEKDAFLKQAPKSFVLVELDYPRKKELPADLKEQNAQLRERYKVRGYPTVLLLDAEGQPVAKTGYRPGSAEDYVDNLQDLSATHAKIVALTAKATKLKGLERAKLLDEIVTATDKLGLENDAVAKYGDEIVKLDRDDKAGLKTKYTFRNLLAEAEQLKADRKFAEALKAYDKAAALPRITGQQKQDACFSQGECYFMQRDFVGVVAALKKAQAAAPDSPTVDRIKPMLARFAPLAEAQATLAKLKSGLEKAKGLERAKVLDQMVDAQTKLGQGRPGPEVEKWSQEIIALDPDNKAGLKTKYEFRELLSKATQHLRSDDADKARPLLVKAQSLPGLSDAQKTQLQRLLKSLPEPKQSE